VFNKVEVIRRLTESEGLKMLQDSEKAESAKKTGKD